MSPPDSLGFRDFHRSPLSPPADSGPGSSHGNAAPAPRPWPRTDRPLSIAMLGWARLSSQGKEGSGYNLSKSELARGLSLAGHHVSYLQSGMAYRLPVIGGAGLRGGRTHIRARETWAGIECFELINAPNVSPAAMNFHNVAEETASPLTTRLVLDWLARVNAEVVHIHSQEGYGLDLIGAIEAAGIPVIVTPHNYWFLCSQVDLLYREAEVCLDFDGGRRCTGCMPGENLAAYKRRRAVGQSLVWMLGMYPADVVRKMAYGAKPLLRSLLKGNLSRRAWVRPLNPERLPDPELAMGFDIGGASDGQIIHDAPLDPHEAPRDYTPATWDTNEQVLNPPGPEGRQIHLRVLNEFGKRRRAGVAALASASLVSPPSDYLRKVHVAMGVPEEKTRWVRLGQPHFDQINRRTRRSPFYSRRPWDPATSTTPLRLAFFGTVRSNKGLEVLTRAIPLLEPHIRQRCQFTIHAMGHEFGFRKRLSRFPEVAVWGGYDLMQLIGSGGDYDVGILPHIWLENSPLVLLENFHAGKFVICSRLGGPVDWIHEGVNGLLFPGGDEHALAECIRRLVTGAVPLPSARDIHQSTILRSYPEHVGEIEAIYREVIAARRSGVPGVSAASEPAPVAAPSTVHPSVTVRPAAAESVLGAPA